jgi:predicted nuclease of predicted toxin-antitoxin system
MKVLIDVNLSPKWVHCLHEAGIEAVHWSDIGKLNATDYRIMNYAKTNEFVVFTHDLDFGSILAITDAKGPSVIQIRSQDTAPDAISQVVLQAMHQFSSHLKKGALINVTPHNYKARILPINRE